MPSSKLNQVYTLGYTGTKPADIKATAIRLNATVVDIRFSPNSRVPQWSGQKLKELLGDRYLYVHDLGNEGYKTGTLKIVNIDAGIRQLKDVLKGRGVILLCACKHVEECHRSYVAMEVSKALKVSVTHLNDKSLTSAEPEAEQGTLL